MPSKVDFIPLSESSLRPRRDTDELSAKRRGYNRAYMRAWRADPRHQLRERANRERAYYERKLREALRDAASLDRILRPAVCGLCGKLPPVAEIVRLRVCDRVRGGYVAVRVPYCGQC